MLGDVVVAGGDLHLTPTADVRGDAVLIGGALIRDPGATLTGAVSETTFRGWVGAHDLLAWRPGPRWGEVRRWLRLAGTMGRVALLACLMVLVLAVARAPVARVGRAAAAQPIRAAVVGLVAEVLFLPLLLAMSISLGITIIGLPFVALLVPLAIVLAVVALLLITAFACRLGSGSRTASAGGRPVPGWPPRSVWRSSSPRPCWRAWPGWRPSRCAGPRSGCRHRRARRVRGVDDRPRRDAAHWLRAVAHGAAADRRRPV